MELFSLLAKLTLDTNEYDKEVEKVTNQKYEGSEVSLSLDKEDFSDGIAEATEETEKFSDTAESSFSAVKTALVATGIVAVLTQITNLFKQAINQTVETADAIDKGSQRMNISTKQYQMWNHALEQSGGNINDLSRGLLTFRDITAGNNDLMGESVELTEDQANAFDKLGIRYEDFKTADALMMEVMDKLAAMSDINARDSIVDKLFGRNSGGIKPLLNEGVEGMHQLLEESERLGLIMTDEEIDNAVEYGDAVANLKAELQAVQSAFVKDVIPVLTDGVKMVTAIVAFFNPNAKNTLSSTLEDINEEAAISAREAEDAAEEAKSLIDYMIDLGDKSGQNAEEQYKWNKAAERAIELFPELGGVIDKESGQILGNTEEIKANIDQWKDAMKEKALYLALEKKQQAIVEQGAKAWEKEWQAQEKLREADRHRAEAIAELNKYSFTGFEKLGEDATFEQIQEAANKVALAGADPEWSEEVSQMIKGMEEPLEEAKRLQREADKMNAEVEKAKRDLAEETEYLNSVFDKTEEKVEAVSDAIDDMPNKKTVTIDVIDNVKNIAPFFHAKGAWDVPYDNYPAMLHRNEMVLTASQARHYREGDGIDYARLENALIAAVQKGMDNAQVNAYIDGRAVTDSVSRELAGQLQGRRFG